MEGGVGGYQTSCPGCGATVVFRLGKSRLAVCASCGVALARKGPTVESYGRVADLIPTSSLLDLGLSGRVEGAGEFVVAGRLQLDYGAGAWDEWFVSFANGRAGWLSESQGKFHLLFEAALAPVPDHPALSAGDTIDLGPPGSFVVSEVRSARFVTAVGELPFAVPPGTMLHYADLSGPRGRFATLDYGEGSTAEAAYVGAEVKLADLHFQGLRSAAERLVAADGDKLACPNCGGRLELRAPDLTKRVGCPWCGSLLDATGPLAVLEVLEGEPVKPRLLLGSTGVLDGVTWTVIGFMVRSTTVEGIRYSWSEYLLYDPAQTARGFRWLVEQNGHWSLVAALNPGDIKDQRRTESAAVVVHDGRRFKHFQTGRAVVDHVLGEFYWAVARGNTVEMRDYVSPPQMLSAEIEPKEMTWSLGSYREPAEIATAFGVKDLPRASGVAPNQPSPYGERLGALWRTAGILFAAMAVVFLLLSSVGGSSVLTQSFTLDANLAPGSPESVLLSDRFHVTRRGNLQIRVTAPVDGNWLYLEGALINDLTGEVDDLDLEASYYHGVDGGESWSEGRPRATRYLGQIAPGTYLLRFAPQFDRQHPVSDFRVEVRSAVPRFLHFFLAGLALLVPPIVVAWLALQFEKRRWSESDHPWTSE